MITRQEVMGLNDAINRLPKDIKDFEYQYCLIENSERLGNAVTKIKDSLKAAAEPVFLEKSKTLSEEASEIMQKAKPAIEWGEAMNKALTAWTKKDREAYIEMQKKQATLEAEYLDKEADVALYQIDKSELPKPFPLNQEQSIAFRYFIK